MVLKSLGIPESSNLVSFEDMDKNNDGTVTQGEFIKTMLHFIENYDRYVSTCSDYVCLLQHLVICCT